TNWLPWGIAAVSLLALGVSLGMHAQAPMVARTPAAQLPQAPIDLATTPTDLAATPTLVEADEPADDVVIEDMDDPNFEPPIEEASERLVTSAAEPQGPKVDSKSETSEPKSEAAPGADAQASSSEPAQNEDVAVLDSGDTPSTDEAPPFSSSAASSALREATVLAQGCRSAGDPTGNATVVVTFAPSGRVTRAAVTGEPFAGTTTGGCIASRFRTARVP